MDDHHLGQIEQIMKALYKSWSSDSSSKWSQDKPCKGTMRRNRLSRK